MKPVIALVGRPNVGKSTLFNRLTRSRDALVADLPGLTRDRHYGEGRVGERPFLVIDTGGFEPVAKEGIFHEMAKQTRQAVVEADVVRGSGQPQLDRMRRALRRRSRASSPNRPAPASWSAATGMSSPTITSSRTRPR